MKSSLSSLVLQKIIAVGTLKPDVGVGSWLGYPHARSSGDSPNPLRLPVHHLKGKTINLSPQRCNCSCVRSISEGDVKERTDQRLLTTAIRHQRTGAKRNVARSRSQPSPYLSSPSTLSRFLRYAAPLNCFFLQVPHSVGPERRPRRLFDAASLPWPCPPYWPREDRSHHRQRRCRFAEPS